MADDKKIKWVVCFSGTVGVEAQTKGEAEDTFWMAMHSFERQFRAVNVKVKVDYTYPDDL